MKYLIALLGLLLPLNALAADVIYRNGGEAKITENNINVNDNFGLYFGSVDPRVNCQDGKAGSLYFRSNGSTFVKTNNGLSCAWSLNATASSIAWGNILGTLANQTDLQAALDAKEDKIDLTEGSVLFVGSDGNVDEDNDNLFYDKTDKRLGIGTNAPAYEIETRASGGSRIYVASSTTNFNDESSIAVVDGAGGNASFSSFRGIPRIKNNTNTVFEIGNIFNEAMITTRLFNIGFNTQAPLMPIQMNFGISGTANGGSLSLGDAPFDGTTSGFFTGVTDGTMFAINGTSLLGDLVNFQVNGFPKLSVSSRGRMAVATLPDASVMLKVQSIGGGDPPFQALDPVGQNVLRINTDTAIAMGQLSNFILVGSSIGGGDINGTGMQFYSSAESSTNTLQNFYFSPYNFFRGNTSGTSSVMTIRSDFKPTAGSGSNNGLEILYDINSSGAQTGTKTGILVNATETALNGMTHNLIDLKTAGTSQFSVSGSGEVNTPKGMNLNTAGSQPTCAAGIRGKMWIIQGGAGVADIFQICSKTVLDTYVWVTH